MKNRVRERSREKLFSISENPARIKLPAITESGESDKNATGESKASKSPVEKPEVKPEVTPIFVQPESDHLKSTNTLLNSSKSVQIKESENEYYETEHSKSPQTPEIVANIAKTPPEKTKKSESSKHSGFMRPGGLDRLWTSAKNNFRVKRTVRMIKVKAA